jgi:MFS family permease
VAVGADVARLAAVAPDYVRTMAGYQRRNVALLILDGATFAFAISLLSETTILPAFVRGLSDSALLVGLLGAIYAVGHYLPQLIGAHLVQGRPRRKPAMLAIVIAERVGILAIAVVAQTIGAIPDGVVLALFFVAFCGYAITTGLIGPVYGDFIAKAFTRGRGWYYAVSQLLGGALGFSAALVAERLIRDLPFPLGNQLCFWICFGLSFLSIVFISLLREEPYPLTEPRHPLRATLSQIPGILKGDRPYRRFLGARALLALATMAMGFVVVDGIEGPLRPSDAALLAAVFILSQAALGFVLSLLGASRGWKTVVVLGGVLLVLGMAGALVADGLPVYVLVFVALGGANAVTIIADPNMSMEYASPATTSVYLGTTSTLLAPFFIAGPLLAGWLAPIIGYAGVFILAGAVAIAGLVLALTLAEPRRLPGVETTTVGQPGTTP